MAVIGKLFKLFGGLVLLLLALLIVVGSLVDDDKGTKTAKRQPDAVDNAYAICGMFQKAGAVSDCDVSGWGRTIDISVDVRGSQALKACNDLASGVAQFDNDFDGKWKVQIFSPFRGDNVLASCVLR